MKCYCGDHVELAQAVELRSHKTYEMLKLEAGTVGKVQRVDGRGRVMVRIRSVGETFLFFKNELRPAAETHA